MKLVVLLVTIIKGMIKKTISYLIFFCFISVNSFAKLSFQSQNTLINSGTLQQNMDCNRLVEVLGGLDQIELLWLGNLKEEKFQYALINNTGKDKKKYSIFVKTH